MSLNNRKIEQLDFAIRKQFKLKDLTSALDTALAVLDLLGCKPDSSSEDITLTKLQLPNAERYDHWFQPHPFFKSNRSCFELVDSNNIPIQAKFYWLQKKSKMAISGGVHFSPNWEDSEYTRTEGYKVGIDFFLSPNAESLLVVLSDRGNLRLVELNEWLRSTQVEIFSAWLLVTEAPNPEILHSALWKTFQLQAVNEKFYIGVANGFTELVHYLAANVPSLDEASAKQFTNRLIGRLLFCWFLRKRDILEIEQNYFDALEFNSNDYYHAKLEPLFFFTLNTPINDRAEVFAQFIKASKKVLSESILTNLTADLTTPYLNGGLFEEHENDFFNKNILEFPDGFFVRLYEHFNSYNFTTDESSPEYEQVAIDPEMLGKVFESLLATQLDSTGDQARQAIGAFYTPRNIVTFMCSEAIRKTLHQRFASNFKAIEAVDALIDTSDAQWASAGTNSKRDALKGLGSEILSELKQIKIFDPACGSGAFPIGMLQLLVKLHNRITNESNSYSVKLFYLEKTLFGTDIEPMAIEISKLRAWLSLIVDQDESKIITALPNLDFHFICCNSLLKLNKNAWDTLEFFDDPKEELAALKTKYFYSNNPKEKKQIQVQYEEFLQKHSNSVSDKDIQLMTYHPFNSDKPAEFFDKTEMFGLETGFDIVISNPPYVRQERIKYKNLLSNYAIFNSTSDLYTYFFEMGFSNLRESGVLSYITSSKYGRTVYGSSLRSLIANEKSIDYLVDYGTDHVFTAITNTWVIQVTNKEPETSSIYRYFESIDSPPIEKLQSELSGKAWSFSGQVEERILSRMDECGTKLVNLPYSINSGIKTGCDKAFVVSEEVAKELIEKDSKNAEIIKPVLRGRDIFRYKPCISKDWLLVTRDGINIKNNFPSIARFLEKKDKELEGRASSRGDRGTSWMNLRPCAYYELIENKKIIFQRISDVNNFTLSTNSEYLMNTLWMINGEDLEYLLGILNSRLIRFYMKNRVAPSTGMATLEWTKFAVEQLPIPVVTSAMKSKADELRNLVKKRLKVTDTNSDSKSSIDLENSIEELVFELYGLVKADIETVDASLASDNLL